MLTRASLEERLRSAQVRLDELSQPKYLGDAGPRLPEGQGNDRLRLAQEFFFHLLGSVEIVAQIINERRSLGIARPTIGNVCPSLREGDALLVALDGLCQDTLKEPMPDAYSEEGLLFRAFLYRHSVTHRHINPFVLRIGSPESTVSLLVDPRIVGTQPHANLSTQLASIELRGMLIAVAQRCTAALELLEESAS